MYVYNEFSTRFAPLLTLLFLWFFFFGGGSEKRGSCACLLDSWNTFRLRTLWGERNCTDSESWAFWCQPSPTLQRPRGMTLYGRCWITNWCWKPDTRTKRLVDMRGVRLGALRKDWRSFGICYSPFHLMNVLLHDQKMFHENDQCLAQYQDARRIPGVWSNAVQFMGTSLRLIRCNMTSFFVTPPPFFFLLNFSSTQEDHLLKQGGKNFANAAIF